MKNSTKLSHICLLQTILTNYLKEILSPDGAIILGDFAEYFCGPIQNTKQWLMKEAVVPSLNCHCYMKEQLEQSSFCIISDNLNHGIGLASQVIHQSIDLIKTNLCLSITKIKYFSDGCTGQYKNCKHFYNWCNLCWRFYISTNIKKLLCNLVNE